MLVLANKSLKEISFNDEELYTYIGTEKIEINGRFILDYDNKISKVELSDKSLLLDSTPLYFKQQQQLILPKNMLNVNYNTGNQTKVPYYTNIKYENSGYYYILNNKKNKVLNSFLYDGKDLYLFLDETEIKNGTTIVTIPAMSYVIYNSNEELYVFDYKNSSVLFYKDIDEPKAYIKNIVLNLKNDSLESGKYDKILIKNFINLKSIELE